MDVPDDVWPCSYVLLGKTEKGESRLSLGCFLVQAASHVEAQAKAKDYAGQLAERLGFPAFHSMVNNVPGEGSVIDLENASYKCVQEKTNHRYVV